MVDITELKQKRMQIVTEQRKKLDLIDARGTPETSEEAEEFKKQDVDIDGLTQRIDREERQVAREAELARLYYEGQNGNANGHTNGNANGNAAEGRSQVFSVAAAASAGHVDMWAPE